MCNLSNLEQYPSWRGLLYCNSVPISEVPLYGIHGSNYGMTLWEFLCLTVQRIRSS